MKTTMKRAENMRGGKGHVIMESIIGENEFKGKGRLFAKVTLEPGCSIGYHEHHNESETYYILSGKGEYDDNGTRMTVSEGDVTFTPDGCGHGIENTGDENLVFMALILLY